MAKQKIAWLLPEVLEGSGGHRTIFNKINKLHENGYLNDIYFYSTHESRLSEAITNLETYFHVTVNEVYAGTLLQGDYLASVATLWDGAKFVAGHPVKHKIHFIQDYEAMFNPMGDGYLLGENAYTYDVTPIVLGKWLWKMMRFYYGKSPYLCNFGVDKNIYFHENDNRNREKAVCFIYQPEKPRRGHRIGLEALGIVKHEIPDAQIYLYGSKEDAHVWYEADNLKLLKPTELGDFYRRCSVGLCISSSNPSRIPFEMMACGLPVVDIYRTNNLYDYNDHSIYLAHQSPESIATAIIQLLKSEKARNNLSKGGIELTDNAAIESEDEDFFKAFEAIVAGKKPDIEDIPVIYQRGAVISPDINSMPLNNFLGRQKTLLEQ